MLSPETLKKLQLEQEKLDNFIIQKKNLSDIKDRQGFVRSKIALLVEIGELANELKTFKHWKSQKDINFDKAKEELIDCFHFFLSFSKSFQIDFSDYKFRKLAPDVDYNELLLALFSETELFSVSSPWNEIEKISLNFLAGIKWDKNKESFYRWLIIFEELCQKLGMKDEKDIEVAYMSKNQINWDRQKAGY